MDHIEKDVIAKRSEVERHVRAQLCICNPCILSSDWCDMVVELFDQLIVVWMIAEDLINACVRIFMRYLLFDLVR
jgi:hypothetical protein